MRKHRKTLHAIFTEPIRANIPWADIEALLATLGAERYEGRGEGGRPGSGEIGAAVPGGRRYQAMMQYKGYTGRVEFDDRAELFHGEVIGLRDVITFQGRTVNEVKKAFRESVDDYLAFCSKRGEEPEKPFTGKLLLRLPPDLHRKAYVAAKQAGTSLNVWITQRLAHETQHLD